MAPQCALCLVGAPLGVVPRGPCRGQPCCGRCLEALHESYAPESDEWRQAAAATPYYDDTVDEDADVA